ncbi:MAG: prepilin-type N-terminal cleavage/methylation domain-containing protein [Phormidesmis sp.]
MDIEENRPTSSIAGFTLIEVLVVVIIVGVLASIAAPGWLRVLNRQRVNTVRTELKAALKDAQIKAQQKSTSYSVIVGSTANGPTVALSTTGTTFPAQGLGSNVSNIQLSTFINSTASTENLTFDYRGGVETSSIPFVIKVAANNDSNSQKCLIVNSLLGGIVEGDGATCDNPILGE